MTSRFMICAAVTVSLLIATLSWREAEAQRRRCKKGEVLDTRDRCVCKKGLVRDEQNRCVKAKPKRKRSRSTSVKKSAQTGKLFVDANVQGAAVYVNSERKGVTPMTVRLQPGEYILALRKGTASWEGMVTIRADRTTSKKIDVAKDNVSLGVVHRALAKDAPMRFIGLSGGEFRMGSPATENGRGSDETEHRVKVSGFEIAEKEVTQKQWKLVMGANPSICKYGCGDDLPVQNISWFDAVEFLNRLSKREGLDSCYEVKGKTVTWKRECEGYRLPTEAEWEYAARAGSRTAYAFGDDASKLGEYGWYDKNAGNKVHAVGSLKPNGWGLHDMHGNVWEWAWDWYGAYPGSSGNVALDPMGPISGERRVLRGGSSWDWAQLLRSAGRVWFGPSYRYWSWGLRCVRGPRRQP